MRQTTRLRELLRTGPGATFRAMMEAVYDLAVALRELQKYGDSIGHQPRST